MCDFYDLVNIIEEAFQNAVFIVVMQNDDTDFYKDINHNYAVICFKKAETSKRIRRDVSSYWLVRTYTVAVRCYGWRNRYNGSTLLYNKITDAVKRLSEAVELCSVDIGDLSFDSPTERLRCDVLLTVKGYQRYDIEEDD